MEDFLKLEEKANEIKLFIAHSMNDFTIRLHNVSFLIKSKK